jgi:hypothetical protein
MFFRPACLRSMLRFRPLLERCLEVQQHQLVLWPWKVTLDLRKLLEREHTHRIPSDVQHFTEGEQLVVRATPIDRAEKVE